MKKNWNGNFESEQNKFESNLKIKLYGKRLDPTESVKYGVLKQTLVGNIMWMTFLLNWIKPALLFKKGKYIC